MMLDVAPWTTWWQTDMPCRFSQEESRANLAFLIDVLGEDWIKKAGTIHSNHPLGTEWATNGAGAFLLLNALAEDIRLIRTVPGFSVVLDDLLDGKQCRAAWHVVRTAAMFARGGAPVCEFFEQTDVKVPDYVIQSKSEKINVEAKLLLSSDKEEAFTNFASPLLDTIMKQAMSAEAVLGLQWADIEHDRSRIIVRRSWVEEVGDCKNVYRKAPVAMHPVLGGYLQHWHGETMYAKPNDWVFASTKLKGRKPRCGSIASQTFLYPAAAKAGVFHSAEKRNRKGALISVRYFDLSGNPIKRWGWHNLRHSLASWLVSNGVDVKTVSAMLRHSNIKTTLGIYSHAVDSNKLAAQGEFLEKLLAGGSVQ
jgi:integrase